MLKIDNVLIMKNDLAEALETNEKLDTYLSNVTIEDFRADLEAFVDKKIQDFFCKNS